MTATLDLSKLPPSGDGTVRFRAVVPPDLVFLRGHFEGQPILPAVVQVVGLALEGSAREWPDLVRVRRLSRLKFRRPIGPGAALEVVLRRSDGEPRVDFVIREGEETCSSGTLGFGS